MTNTIRPEHTKTEIVIAEMLTESTGTHMLDSGGASGRAWQRNQREVKAAEMTPVEFFKVQPDAWFGWPTVYPHPNFRDGKDVSEQRAELWITVHIFHWLTQVATIRPDLDAMFDDYDKQESEGKEDWDQPSWLLLASEDEFPEYHAKRVRDRIIAERNDDEDFNAEDVSVTVTGICGDSRGASTDYTYNYDNTLSQDIHFTTYGLNIQGSPEIEWEDDQFFAIVSIHGGADARGGFTKPRVMEVAIDGDCFGFFDYNQGIIYCDNSDDCGVYWDMGCDFGYGYNRNGDDVGGLDDFPAEEGDKGIIGKIIIHQPNDVQYPGPETIVHCPLCATGKLTPAIY